MTAPVRVGVLGCAAVSDYALLGPARTTGALSVDAVASRDLDRAATYGRAHGIPRWYGSYDELLNDEALDAIYVALPNALHHDWSMAALRRGYAVLCEKPLASNANQAAAMAAIAEETGCLLVEAFHWRHHPVASRLVEIIAAGALGRLRHIEAFFHVPRQYLDPGNIRLDFALGGGSMMDQGCYCVNLIRLLGGCEPTVSSASATEIRTHVDGSMSVALELGNGVTGRIECSMDRESDAVKCGASVVGERGELSVENPFLPSVGSRIFLRTADKQSVECPPAIPSYDFQAQAFAEAVRCSRTPWPARDGVANMRVIDAAYRAAGLPLRP